MRRAWFALFATIALCGFALLVVRASARRPRPDAGRARLEDKLAQRGLSFPPSRVTLLAFKRERVLEVWADAGARPVLVATYPILAASGTLGPKRREGDLQVPEGIYALPVLNPKSRFHLSVRIDYPNAQDRAVLGPGPLGGDIYLHGGAASIGCIAIGDEAIEEVFALLAAVPRREIVIAPVDFRRDPDAMPVPSGEPWLLERYERVKERLRGFTRT